MAAATISRHPAGPRLRAGAAALVAFAVLALLLYLSASDTPGERAAIGQLPEVERQALYERTLRSLETTCRGGERPDGLERFCREQAEFVVQFPQCDAGCQRLARTHLPTPSR